MSMGTEGGAGGFLRAMSGDVRGLLRQELRQTQDEWIAKLRGKVRRAGRGAGLLAGAGVFTALAAGTGAVLVLRVLEALLPSRAAALVATVLFGSAAAGLAAAGLKEIRRSESGPAGGYRAHP